MFIYDLTCFKTFYVFSIGSSVPTQPEKAVYAGCMPLHLSEEKIFSLVEMVILYPWENKRYTFIIRMFNLVTTAL